MSKAINRLLSSDLSVSVLYRAIRGFQSTYRFTVENEQPWLDRVSSGRPVVLCCWHQQFFSAIRHFGEYSHLHPALMISQSKDGGIIAGVAERTGWDIVRGSSSRGGAMALEVMASRLRERKLAGHVVDGPRGPAGTVKAGLIRLAQLADASIAPFHILADKAWFFDSWDRFMVPKPFSRVRLCFLSPMELSISGPEDFERERCRVEGIMLPSLISR
jgi:lysophospholipid acyltransferase (LPLAT)-like uncharacterized protein